MMIDRAQAPLLFYSILFYSILFFSFLFYSILFYYSQNTTHLGPTTHFFPEDSLTKANVIQTYHIHLLSSYVVHFIA